MTSTDTVNPIDVLRARILELEAELALMEDANFYLMAENARLRYLPNTKVSNSGQETTK